MDDIRTEEFLRNLAQHERSVSSYVYGLVPNRADADEILQETKIVTWKKFDDFQEGTNFSAWARKIALGIILNHRRSIKRRKTTPTESAFIEAVAAEMDRFDTAADLRTDALETCLKKLPVTHRELILWRYYDDEEISEIADKANRTETAVYRMLSRIRKTLQECISAEYGRGTEA